MTDLTPQSSIMAPEIFISHNGNQKPWVRRLVEQWRELGLRVFFDEDSIEPGAAVVATLQDAVAQCRHVVLVLSPAALESRWVAMEIAMAAVDDPDGRERRIIPVMVERIDPQRLGLSLRRLSIVDLTDQDQRQATYHRLLRSLGLKRADLPSLPELDPAPGTGGTSQDERSSADDGSEAGGITTATARAQIELVINRDLKEFNADQREKLLKAIEALLETDDTILIRSIRRGSVILTLDLSLQDAERLYWAVQTGALRDLGVISASSPDVENVTEAVPPELWRGDAKDPWSPPGKTRSEYDVRDSETVIKRLRARLPLRDQVHHAIIDRILRDEFKPGARISDTALARELGVSRTPIREALLRLEREGFLEVDVGRGFFVRPLSVREVREVYPVLWTLEVLALRTCAPLTADRRAELDRINAALESESEAERRIDLDSAWHQTLLETCGNDYLLGLIASLKSVIRRYEYAYMQNAGYIPVSTRTHEQIAELVAAGDLEAAVPLLENNWRFTMESLLRWLHEVV